MCLVIDSRRHLHEEMSSVCPGFKPLIAKKPFTVYKILDFNNCGLQTPFQREHINFISDSAVLEAPMMDYYQEGWNVYIGIHVFRKKTNAKNSLEFWSRELTLNLAIYQAIVPVDTKYFYGINDEIVSEKLIIKNKIVK